MFDKVRRDKRNDLLEREEAARKAAETHAQNLSKEKSLREEATRILQEEMRIMREEIEREKRQKSDTKFRERMKHSATFRIKVKYNRNNLTEEQVENLLNEALPDSAIAFSRKKK